jgi:hypothetical protein
LFRLLMRLPDDDKGKFIFLQIFAVLER